MRKGEKENRQRTRPHETSSHPQLRHRLNRLLITREHFTRNVLRLIGGRIGVEGAAEVRFDEEKTGVGEGEHAFGEFEGLFRWRVREGKRSGSSLDRLLSPAETGEGEHRRDLNVRSAVPAHP
jgi:hypothetical protein